MYGRVRGVGLVGAHGVPIVVEAYVGRGLPALILTGLPGASAHDARERVRPAVENCGFEWPLRRVVVNLSPADLRKDGPGLDLPIAMAVVTASQQVPSERLANLVFAGELSLEGRLMPTPGILAVVLAAAEAGARGVVVPDANAREAALVEGLEVIGARSLVEVVGYLRGEWQPLAPLAASDQGIAPPAPVVDFSEVRGQQQARRALEVAAAGGHNVLMTGSPGSGKTMLAHRVPGILPLLTREEALDVTRLHSVAGLLADGGLAGNRPFRAPHHSVSPAGLLGGGSGQMRPGEVSLAHHGVLFLDELTEFRRDAIEGLRQPLEDGRVVITRSAGTVRFPARFTLVAAANPCPCGFDGDSRRPCSCRPDRVEHYRQKLSGPLLDRIDMRLAVPRLSQEELFARDVAESSAAIRARVEEGRDRQRRRYRSHRISCNAQVPGPQIRADIVLDRQADRMLRDAVDLLQLTGRGVDRTLRVARTIADLAGQASVDVSTVAEALSYRSPGNAVEAGAGAH